MSPVDRGRGEVRAARSIREVGDIAREHGVRLAVEFNSQCEQLNALGPDARGDGAGRPSRRPGSCSTRTTSAHRRLAARRSRTSPREIAYVQYSDVPATGLEPGKALDRLPPGQGSVPFREFFAAFVAKGYAGYASYEAPNPRRGSARPRTSRARRSPPPARCCPDLPPACGAGAPSASALHPL